VKRKRFKLVGVSPVSKEKNQLISNDYKRFSGVSGVSPVQDENRALGHGISCVEEKEHLPYLKDGIELIIPLDTPDRYRWWAGGQSIFDTLLELNAPDELIARHVGEVGSPKSWRRWQHIRKSRGVGQVPKEFDSLPNDFDNNGKGETLGAMVQPAGPAQVKPQ